MGKEGRIERSHKERCISRFNALYTKLNFVVWKSMNNWQYYEMQSNQKVVSNNSILLLIKSNLHAIYTHNPPTRAHLIWLPTSRCIEQPKSEDSVNTSRSHEEQLVEKYFFLYLVLSELSKHTGIYDYLHLILFWAFLSSDWIEHSILTSFLRFWNSTQLAQRWSMTLFAFFPLLADIRCY